MYVLGDSGPVSAFIGSSSESHKTVPTSYRSPSWFTLRRLWVSSDGGGLWGTLHFNGRWRGGAAESEWAREPRSRISERQSWVHNGCLCGDNSFLASNVDFARVYLYLPFPKLWGVFLSRIIFAFLQFSGTRFRLIDSLARIFDFFINLELPFLPASNIS